MKLVSKKMRNILLALSLFGVLLIVIPQKVFASSALPVAPSTCSAVRSLDGTAVRVDWTSANNDNADRYIVERRRNKGRWYWTGRAPAPAITYTDSTLRPQDSYEIRVYTRRADGTKSGVRSCELTTGSIDDGPADKGVVPERTNPEDPSENPSPGSKPSDSGSDSGAVVPSPNPKPVQASGPVPVPACGAYWGSYVNSRLHGGGDDAQAKLRAINSVEDQIGRTFDIDHQFYRWDNFASDHNVKHYINTTVREGRIPFLSWKPVMADNTNVSWKAIGEGKYDAMIRENAQTVKSLGVPVFMVFDHEANGRVGKFSPEKSTDAHNTIKAGSEAEFVAAWQHVHDLFAEQGVTNVSWAWIMTRTPFAGDASFADRMYPGDEYVDWVGLDPYNFFHGGKTWRDLDELMVGFTNWVDTRGVDKPWMLGEWGSVEDPNNPGRKGQWYDNAANYIESEPRLKATVHFESTPKYNWRFDSSPSSKSAFTAAGQRSQFKQTC